MTTISENLLNGKVFEVLPHQLEWEAKKTKEMKEKLGECRYLCAVVAEYGWVQEEGCPVHDA